MLRLSLEAAVFVDRQVTGAQDANVIRRSTNHEGTGRGRDVSVGHRAVPGRGRDSSVDSHEHIGDARNPRQTHHERASRARDLAATRSLGQHERPARRVPELHVPQEQTPAGNSRRTQPRAARQLLARTGAISIWSGRVSICSP